METLASAIRSTTINYKPQTTNSQCKYIKRCFVSLFFKLYFSTSQKAEMHRISRGAFVMLIFQPFYKNASVLLSHLQGEGWMRVLPFLQTQQLFP